MSKITKKKLNELRKEIQKHDYQYYVLDAPLISDYEYDRLFEKLKAWEFSHPQWKSSLSPTQRVPGKALDKFSKASHRQTMLSLENTYSIDEFVQFTQKLLKSLDQKEVCFFCEPKLDGAAVELVYEKGRLVRALTRGDGKIGENVLENIKTIKTVPLEINTSCPVFEVRAEVVLFKKDFIRINKEQKKMGGKIYSNPRNAAAGGLRNLDPKISAQRKLRLFCHSPGVIQGSAVSSHSGFFNLLKKYTLPSFTYSDSIQAKKNSLSHPLCLISNQVEECINYYKVIQEMRTKLPFEIDGIVVKVDSFSAQRKLGFTGRSPKWAVAVKFPPDSTITQVEDIIAQTGRTGIIVPVARMKPVSVGGVMVSQASLHNFNELKKKDVRIGDYVYIKRAGDVIPEIESVLLSKRLQKSRPFKVPKVCPSCSHSLTDVEDSLYCFNSQCRGVLLRKLQHFCSKKAMNIESLGDQIVEQLLSKKWVQSFSDIYKLKSEKLKTLDGFADQSTQNIINSIELSKQTLFAPFLFALGIRHIGEMTAVKIAEFFGGGKKGFQKLLSADKETLIQVENVGDIAAESLIKGLKDLYSEIHRLFELGIKIQSQKKTSFRLDGLNFVITGSFEKPRKELELIIKDHGGAISSSVSKKTNYLLCGKDPGSKYAKAQQLKVPSLNWNQFQKLIS